MASATGTSLTDLYRDLASALAGRGRKAEAADAWGLAMYYARQSRHDDLADECHRQLERNNPAHVLVERKQAPLLFAQLLMKYPADEAERLLGQLESTPPEPAAITTSSAVATEPESVGPSDSVTPAPHPLTTPMSESLTDSLGGVPREVTPPRSIDPRPQQAPAGPGAVRPVPARQEFTVSPFTTIAGMAAQPRLVSPPAAAGPRPTSSGGSAAPARPSGPIPWEVSGVTPPDSSDRAGIEKYLGDFLAQGTRRVEPVNPRAAGPSTGPKLKDAPPSIHAGDLGAPLISPTPSAASVRTPAAPLPVAATTAVPAPAAASPGPMIASTPTPPPASASTTTPMTVTAPAPMPGLGSASPAMSRTMAVPMIEPPAAIPAPSAATGSRGGSLIPPVVPPAEPEPAAHPLLSPRGLAVTEAFVERHRVFDLGGTAPQGLAALTAPDFLVETEGQRVRDPEPVIQRPEPSRGRSGPSPFLNALGIIVFIIGSSVAGFFGWSLYPEIERLRLPQMMAVIVDDLMHNRVPDLSGMERSDPEPTPGLDPSNIAGRPGDTRAR